MASVSFNTRAVLINGRQQLILSGAIHYPRSTPAMWPRLLAESRKAGLNTIETYVFWEGHEPQEGVYDFDGRRNLGRFLDLCRQEGLHVILRIGPYVCAETNFGGLPWWLIAKPGMVTRTWNAPFLEAVDRWMRRLLAEIGDRQATRGGPVILVQLENEYGNVATRYGADGRKYLAWCVASGRAAGITVPLIMCEGAPDGVIATLNGFSVWSRVADLRKERASQPMLWTEAWTGWYDIWGEPHHLRKVEDIAYEVLRFFAAGGTGVNHYMWHGGTNFERDAMFLQATSYDFDAPLDEYGMPTEKSEGLGVLHRMLLRQASFFLKGEMMPPEVLVHGQYPQQADGVMLHAFRLGRRELVVVLNGNDWPKSVTARNVTLEIPCRSAAVLLGSGTRFQILYRSWTPPARAIARTMTDAGKSLTWTCVAVEALPAATDAVTLPHNMLLATRDETDYGWYATTLSRTKAGTAVLRGRVSDFVTVWVNGRRIGTAPARLKEERRPADFEFAIEVPLRRGVNRLVLLVNAIGLIKGDWSIDAPQSEEQKGLLAPLTLDGEPLVAAWTFTAGLAGERKLAQAGRIGPKAATPASADTSDGLLRWHEAAFTVTARDLADGRPWAFQADALGKGMLFVNGQMLGRYWQLPAIDARHARHTRHPHLINTGYEVPTQRDYHIPAAWLRKGRNTLLLLEETDARPEGARLVRRQ